MVDAGVDETRLLDWDAWVYRTRGLQSASSVVEEAEAHAVYERYLAVRHREIDLKEKVLDMREAAIEQGFGFRTVEVSQSETAPDGYPSGRYPQ